MRVKLKEIKRGFKTFTCFRRFMKTRKTVLSDSDNEGEDDENYSSDCSF